MRLTDLEAEFIRWEDRIEPRNKVAAGWDTASEAGLKAWNDAGRPSEEVIGPDRGLLDHQGSRSKGGGPSRWAVSGTCLDDLTTDPSVDCGCWHGWIRNGDAT